jgi:hypothetical protein
MKATLFFNFPLFHVKEFYISVRGLVKKAWSARLPPQSLSRLTHFGWVPAASSDRGSRRATAQPPLLRMEKIG